MYSEILLSQVSSYKNQNTYREMRGVSKEVVSYLLDQVEDISKNHKLAIHRIAKNRQKGIREVSIFELKFEFDVLYVHTFHKFGAMQVKCIKNCNANLTIESIKELCKFTGWKIIPERSVKQKFQKLNIIYVPEDETP